MKLCRDEAEFFARCLRDWRQGHPGWTASDGDLAEALAQPECGNPLVALAVYRNGGSPDITRDQVACAAGDVMEAFVLTTARLGLVGDLVQSPQKLAGLFEALAKVSDDDRSDADETPEVPEPIRRIRHVHPAGVKGPTRPVFGGGR